MSRNLPALHVVQETAAMRAAKRFADARKDARAHIENEILRLSAELDNALREVMAGGDVYPVTIREDCSRWISATSGRAERLGALAERLL